MRKIPTDIIRSESGTDRINHKEMPRIEQSNAVREPQRNKLIPNKPKRSIRRLAFHL